MKWSEIFPSTDQLKLIPGIEGELLRQKRLGDTVGISLIVLGAFIQILRGVFDIRYFEHALQYIGNFGVFLINKIPGIDIIFEPALTGFFILLSGIGFIFISRHFNLLIKEADEPFRYTFWIDEFDCAGVPGPAPDANQGEQTGNSDRKPSLKNTDRFLLLHHDLREKLNQRIRRLSLLDPESLKSDSGNRPSHSDTDPRLTAHIQISGHYAIREKKNDEWVVHVMSRIRIGPEGQPSTLAFPVKYPLEENGEELTADCYNQLVEQVYSSVATEIYKQIGEDVKEKMRLFPTNYLRAVALYNEAEDFVRSNTIDAYDHAIKLYREALRYFDIAKMKWVTALMIRLPVLWRFKVKREHSKAKVHIGYAKCLIYRREISALTGRSANPIFEIPPNLQEVLPNLEMLHRRMKPFRDESWSSSFMAFLTYPKDSWFRYRFRQPLESLFERHRRIRFDTHVVAALACSYLGAVKKPREHLREAKKTDPQQSEQNALYLLTAGMIEPDVNKKILLLRQATERAPDFQIARYLLAEFSEMRFRMQNEINKARVKEVIKEYDRVLEINPGNIAALAAEGYLYWLLEDLEEAKKKFQEGCELKAIAGGTFTGQLYYGLARIAAEEARFNDSYDLYLQAISADPGAGAYLVTASSRHPSTPYYNYIVPGILERYENFEETVEKNLAVSHEEVSEKVRNAVHSFVLNDYGNACYNYYSRYGDRDGLNRAMQAYEKAIKKDPENVVAKYDTYMSYRWGEKKKEVEHYLKEIVREIPAWQAAVISLAQSPARILRKRLDEYNREKTKYEPGDGQHEIQITEPETAIMQNGNADTTGDMQRHYETNGRKCTSSMVVNSKAHLEQEIEKSRKELEEAKKIMLSNTKWSSLPDDLKKDRNVHKLLSDHRIRWRRLDDYDAEALRAWTEILSNQKETDPGVIDALCSHILEKFFPEDFNINRVREKVLDNMEDHEGCIQKKDTCTKAIESTIQNWLKQDPIHFFSLEWAREYFKNEDFAEYLERATRLNRATGLEKNNHVYYQMLGNTYNRIGNVFFEREEYRNAIVNYRKAIESDSQTPIYQCNLGRAHGKLEEPEWNDMIIHCRKAVELRKFRPGDDFGLDYYYEFLAEAYFRANRLEEFEREFQADHEVKDNERARVFNRIGNLFYQCEQYENAIPRYWQATERDKQTPVYFSNLVLALMNMERWEEAEKAAYKAIELDPVNAFYENDLGNIYYRSGNFKKAARHYNRAIEKDPQTPVFYSNLVLALEISSNLEGAGQVYQTAINVKSGDAVYQNDLGNAFYQNGDFEKAAECYQRAFEIDPETDVYHSNLGKVVGV